MSPLKNVRPIAQILLIAPEDTEDGDLDSNRLSSALDLKGCQRNCLNLYPLKIRVCWERGVAPQPAAGFCSSNSLVH
jgi:hypothetical protein